MMFRALKNLSWFAPLMLFVCLLAFPVVAETIVATRTIRSQAILTESDIELIEQNIAGALTSPEDVIGMEARVVLYAGRPIRINDIGPPALVERNQIVTLYFSTGGLVIAAEARALGRAGIGDRLRVMNLASRSTVTGWVLQDGSVSVNQPQTPSQ